MNFNPQPGDRVTLRGWDDMAEEFGLNDNDEIKTPCLHILPAMKPNCGHSYIIESVFHDSEGDACRFVGNAYYFPLCSLVGYSSTTSQPVPASPISFDSLFQSLTSP